MKSQSRFLYSLNPNGLGRMPIPLTGPTDYQDRLHLQPIDSGSGPGTTFEPSPLPAATPTFSPTLDQVHEPIRSTAAINPNPHVASNRDKNWTSMIGGLIRMEGDHVVIGGDRRIQKKPLFMASGALITAGLLVTLSR